MFRRLVQLMVVVILLPLVGMLLGITALGATTNQNAVMTCESYQFPDGPKGPGSSLDICVIVELLQTGHGGASATYDYVAALTYPDGDGYSQTWDTVIEVSRRGGSVNGGYYFTHVTATACSTTAHVTLIEKDTLEVSLTPIVCNSGM